MRQPGSRVHTIVLVAHCAPRRGTGRVSDRFFNALIALLVSMGFAVLEIFLRLCNCPALRDAELAKGLSPTCDTNRCYPFTRQEQEIARLRLQQLLQGTVPPDLVLVSHGNPDITDMSSTLFMLFGPSHKFIGTKQYKLIQRPLHASMPHPTAITDERCAEHMAGVFGLVDMLYAPRPLEESVTLRRLQNLLYSCKEAAGTNIKLREIRVALAMKDHTDSEFMRFEEYRRYRSQRKPRRFVSCELCGSSPFDAGDWEKHCRRKAHVAQRFMVKAGLQGCIDISAMHQYSTNLACRCCGLSIPGFDAVAEEAWKRHKMKCRETWLTHAAARLEHFSAASSRASAGAAPDAPEPAAKRARMRDSLYCMPQRVGVGAPDDAPSSSSGSSSSSAGAASSASSSSA